MGQRYLRATTDKVRVWDIANDKHGRFVVPNDNISLEVKQLVVEVVLAGMELPQIIATEDNNGRRTIQDLGIVKALIEYLNNEFPCVNGGWYFKDLHPVHQSKMEDRVLNIFVIQPPTPPEYVEDLITKYRKLTALLTQ